MRKDPLTLVQGNHHHPRAFAPRCSSVQHPRARNSPSRHAVQPAPTPLVYVGSFSNVAHRAHLLSFVDLLIFMSLDLAALIVQAIGGGKASIAALGGQDPEPGGRIMMCGIIVQMVGVTLVSHLLLGHHSLGQLTSSPVLHPQRRLPLPIPLE